MIFQILARSPDLELSASLIIVLTLTEKESEEFCVSLLSEVVPPKLVKACLKVFPAGFVIEGVAYGREDDEDFTDAYDLFIKVLH
jgi:hypothetical protein